MCAKRNGSIGFRLDVCKASQSKLEKLFNHPGVCFGDLRRQRLIAERAMGRMARRQVTYSDLELEYDLQDSLDDYIERYLERRALEERYPQYSECEPSFHGGTLEKQTERTISCRRYKRSVQANNAKQHSRLRPSRETIRRSVSITELEWEMVVKYIINRAISRKTIYVE